MNDPVAEETLSTALISSITLAENDLTYFRIIAIVAAVMEQLLIALIAERPEYTDGLTLAQANIASAHAYLSSLDGQNPA